LFWNNIYWEINIVRDSQFVGGRTDLRWSVICSASVISISKIKTIADESIKDAGNRRTAKRKSVY
jgi:hypothetical protein